MKTRCRIAVMIAGAGVAIGAAAADGGWGTYEVGKLRSGYTYASVETRAMQDDDFENPGFIWVENGGELWTKVMGSAGKSCAACHGEAAESMRGVATRYPVYAPERGKLMNLEQRINQCLADRMGGAAFEWESNDLLSLTTFVRHQSRGLPVAPDITGPAAPFFEQGKAFYTMRIGQLDLACTHCHDWHAGDQLRSDLLSQGQANGFPLYRLEWQTLTSLQRRMRRCNEQVRAEPYPFGDDVYVNLELYLAARGRGLPVETPAVRR